jgi:RHS repeat-associated protein
MALYFETARNVYNGAASGTPALSQQTCYNGAASPCTTATFTLPISSIKTTSTLDGTAVKMSVQNFNSNGLLATDNEYDYSGATLSQRQITYASLTNGILDLPATVVTSLGGSSVPTSTVVYGYDENSLTTKTGLPELASVTGSRGNLTSVQYATGAASPTYITTAQYFYDNAGQLVKSEDAALNSTTYSYDSGTDTFLTGVTYPTTGGVAHSTSSTYDVVRGVKLADFDLNGNKTTYTYDLMLRPSTIATPDGGSQTFAYSLSPGSPYTSVSTLHATGSSVTATSYLDPYGRPIMSDTTDVPTHDLVAYAYDANGNLSSASNPYRSGDAIAYTTTAFDVLGRPTTTTDSDGVSQQKAAYLGNAVTITDEAGHQREIVSDALGRTTAVFEPTSSGSLSLETDYLYDQNVTAGSGSTFTTYQNIINQKGGSSSSSSWRTRIFTLDMLGRTIRSSTPEAGTIGYTYPNGSGSCAGTMTLPCTRTDANGTLTTYAYDALNRLTGKTYGGSSIGTGTPAVTYSYDQTSYNGLTIVNGNGLRTGMSDGSGATGWSFDTLGRITSIRKTVNSITEQAGYTYNADGSTNTLTDFAGTVFTYSYDVSGRPTGLVDGASNSYASSGVYNAAGQLTSLNHKLTSTGASYVRSFQFNNRLQPLVISATRNGSNIQSLTYGYGAGGTNNGNILSIANGMDSSRSETFTYDNLNRLASGRDASHWGENYTYDNWSNLYQTQPMSGLAGNNWSVTANGNNQLSNLTYDAAGQVTKDQYSTSYSYDAEGRILSAGTGAYVYDGDGNRVKKTASGTTTLYWPGADNLLDESNSSGSTMGAQVRFDGILVWRANSSGGSGEFLFQDHLGSTRVTADAAGNLRDDSDYQPYGTLYQNYGAAPSDNHYLFTGYESDSETTSDHATFRNLGMTLGRFNRPDPYDGSYDLTNPQSLNRYAYVLDNPLFFIDILGDDSDPSLCYLTASGCGSDGGGAGGGGAYYGSLELAAGSYYVAVSDGQGNTYYYSTASFQMMVPYGSPLGDGITMDSSGNLFCDGSACGSVSIGGGSVSGGAPGGGGGGEGGGGAGGGGSAPNNGNSNSFLKQWWKDVKNCVGNYGLPTIVNDLNPFSLGIGTVADATSSMSQAALAGAAAHSVERGLTVPLRSSIVRAGMTGSEVLGKISGVATMANVVYALGDGAVAEWNGCL